MIWRGINSTEAQISPTKTFDATILKSFFLLHWHCHSSNLKLKDFVEINMMGVLKYHIHAWACPSF